MRAAMRRVCAGGVLSAAAHRGSPPRERHRRCTVRMRAVSQPYPLIARAHARRHKGAQGSWRCCVGKWCGAAPFLEGANTRNFHVRNAVNIQTRPPHEGIVQHRYRAASHKPSDIALWRYCGARGERGAHTTTAYVRTHDSSLEECARARERGGYGRRWALHRPSAISHATVAAIATS